MSVSNPTVSPLLRFNFAQNTLTADTVAETKSLQRFPPVLYIFIWCRWVTEEGAVEGCRSILDICIRLLFCPTPFFSSLRMRHSEAVVSTVGHGFEPQCGALSVWDLHVPQSKIMHDSWDGLQQTPAALIGWMDESAVIIVCCVWSRKKKKKNHHVAKISRGSKFDLCVCLPIEKLCH